MQVNSAQDYLTKYKRRVIAKSYYTTPPEQKDKTNADYLSTVANGATQRERFIIPAVSGWKSVPGTATYSSACTGCAVPTTAPGTFSTVNTKDVVSRQALRPIGIRSTITQQ